MEWFLGKFFSPSVSLLRCLYILVHFVNILNILIDFFRHSLQFYNHFFGVG